jgi:ABC-type multidrug transport system fused ATPase/permease subunit
MTETIGNIGWAIVFCVIAGMVGMLLVLLASYVVPRLVDRLTPNIDEQKEIARGNGAVAEYYGRVVGAAIIGVSAVVAAAVLGGVMAALH